MWVSKNSNCKKIKFCFPGYISNIPERTKYINKRFTEVVNMFFDNTDVSYQLVDVLKISREESHGITNGKLRPFNAFAFRFSGSSI